MCKTFKTKQIKEQHKV